MQTIRLLPLILFLGLAGCTSPSPPNAVPALHEEESGHYAIFLDDATGTTEWGQLKVTSNAQQDAVVQEIESSSPAQSFSVQAILDASTGGIRQRSDEWGTTYPVGVEAQLPALAKNYNRGLPEETPAVWAFNGAAWIGQHLAWTPGTTQWGQWAAQLQLDKAGYWVNATAACDDGCTATTPTWSTNSHFTTAFLPDQVILASSTKQHQLRLTAISLETKGKLVHVAAQPPTNLPGTAVDMSCMPIPCEGSGLPAAIGYAAAYATVESSNEWASWIQDHPASQLDTFGISHRVQGSTIAGPLPVTGTVWIFRFQSREGELGTFTLQSFDTAIGPTPPLLTATNRQPASSLTPFVTFDAEFTPASHALAPALEQPNMAEIFTGDFSLLLDVGYGELTPNKTLRARWFFVDLDSTSTAVAGGYDGKLLGNFVGPAPPYL